jgi:RNA polymerase sigma-70 factor (ECF subfamily)
MRKEKLNSVIFDNHQKFLAFIRSRVESGEVAEDILQSAYQKGLKKSQTLRNDERVVAWFYRILRNAIIDHYRHRDVEKRILTPADPSVEIIPIEMNPQIEKAICKCMEGLIRDMKPEYADALKEVELNEQKIQSYAKKKGLSQNNATVRLHRARQSLKKRLLETCGACTAHGCLDCNCKRT